MKLRQKVKIIFEDQQFTAISELIALIFGSQTLDCVNVVKDTEGIYKR
jgi:hypothetical protein